MAGGILLGGAGLIAGAVVGGESSINLLCIKWQDGQKSLIEVDGEIFNMLNTIVWNIQNRINEAKFTKNEIVKQEIETKKGWFWFWVLTLSPILVLMLGGAIICPPFTLVLIIILIVLYKKYQGIKNKCGIMINK